MKRLILLNIILLSGCATVQPVTVPKLQAPIEDMKDCGEYIIPQNSFGSFILASTKNKELFELCKSQNKAKKQFILDTTR